MPAETSTASVELLRPRASAIGREVRIEAAPGVVLEGELTVPRHLARSRRLVVFANGLSSRRRNHRNRHAARALNEAGVATLLLDLLTPVEETYLASVFDVELLERRLVAATRWLEHRPETAALAVEYHGASTAQAAARRAA
jgi:putative phosphoribosyl transferase